MIRPYPLVLTPGVAYMVALDPWIIENVWAIQQNQAAQIARPIFHQAVRHPANPLFADGGYCSVLYCPDDVWRCWYQGAALIEGQREPVLSLAESADGITWTRPEINVFGWETLAGVDNVVWAGITGDECSGAQVFLAPEDDTSGYVYLCVYNRAVPSTVNLVGSADGRTWETVSDTVQHAIRIDGNKVLVRSPEYGGWMLFTRPNNYGGAGDQIDKGNQRQFAVSRVPALWSTSEEVDQVALRVDEMDVDAFGWNLIYGTSAMRHASGLYIALIHIFRNNDFVLPTLAWSRDLAHWSRPPIRYVEAGTPLNIIDAGAPDEWDDTMVFPDVNCWVEVEADEEWRIYYAGWDGEHGVEGQTPGEPNDPLKRNVATGLATIGRERLASFVGGAGGNVLSSYPIRWGAGGLFINANPNGGIVQVRVMTESRTQPGVGYAAIPGFSFAECTPIVVDETRIEVTWTAADIRDLQGQIIRLEFYLEDGAHHFALGETDIPGGAEGSALLFSPYDPHISIDGLAYAVGDDFGASVNTAVATLDPDTWHRIVLRGEHTISTQIDLSGFTAGFEVDAIGLRILWAGEGSPIRTRDQTVIIGGQVRRAGSTRDHQLVPDVQVTGGAQVLSLTGVKRRR